MTLKSIARLGDSGFHNFDQDPGNIISSSADVLVDGVGIARNGDLYNCSWHGTVFVLGTSKHYVNGERLVRDGDKTTCDATIRLFAPTTTKSE